MFMDNNNQPSAVEPVTINEEKPASKVIYNGRMDSFLEMDDELKGGFTSFQKVNHEQVTFKSFDDEGNLLQSNAVKFEAGSGRQNVVQNIKRKGEEAVDNTWWFAYKLGDDETMEIYLPWKTVSSESELSNTFRVLKGFFFINHAKVEVVNNGLNTFTKLGVGLSGVEEAKVVWRVEERGRLE
jgi:hypothetical protein